MTESWKESQTRSGGFPLTILISRILEPYTGHSWGFFFQESFSRTLTNPMWGILENLCESYVFVRVANVCSHQQINLLNEILDHQHSVVCSRLQAASWYLWRIIWTAQVTISVLWCTWRSFNCLFFKTGHKTNYSHKLLLISRKIPIRSRRPMLEKVLKDSSSSLLKTLYFYRYVLMMTFRRCSQPWTNCNKFREFYKLGSRSFFLAYFAWSRVYLLLT